MPRLHEQVLIHINGAIAKSPEDYVVSDDGLTLYVWMKLRRGDRIDWINPDSKHGQIIVSNDPKVPHVVNFGTVEEKLDAI